MFIFALKNYEPVRMTVIFILSSIVLIGAPFFKLTNGIDYFGIVMHSLLLYWVVIKLQGYKLYKEFGSIVQKSDNFDDFHFYTANFLKDERYKKIKFFIYIALYWAILSFLF